MQSSCPMGTSTEWFQMRNPHCRPGAQESFFPEQYAAPCGVSPGVAFARITVIHRWTLLTKISNNDSPKWWYVSLIVLIMTTGPIAPMIFQLSCLLGSSFRLVSKKISRRIISLMSGNRPVNGGFPSQRPVMPKVCPCHEKPELW